MKKLIFLILIGTSFACEFKAETTTTPLSKESQVTKDTINRVLEKWHRAAAEANFEKYFEHMSSRGVFIGTDATENWQNSEFREYAKPYFDRGQAWSFKTLERNIYTSTTGQTAWFDELLDTQMGICRGSGVLEKSPDGWKIQHYVLSIAIPNEHVLKVTAIKKENDEKLFTKFK